MAEKKTTKKATEAKSLDAQLLEKQDDLRQAHQSHKAGELVNPRVLRDLRKDIARLKTALHANKQPKQESEEK